jgi:hypothetical protein
VVGLFAFAGGFAVAGLLAMADQGGRSPYLVAVTIGLVGIGAIGYGAGVSRTDGVVTIPEPQPAVWSPAGLRPLAEAVGLRPTWTIAALYALTTVGVLGNLVVPLSGS